MVEEVVEEEEEFGGRGEERCDGGKGCSGVQVGSGGVVTLLSMSTTCVCNGRSMWVDAWVGGCDDKHR